MQTQSRKRRIESFNFARETFNFARETFNFARETSRGGSSVRIPVTDLGTRRYESRMRIPCRRQKPLETSRPVDFGWCDDTMDRHCPSGVYTLHTQPGRAPRLSLDQQ